MGEERVAHQESLTINLYIIPLKNNLMSEWWYTSSISALGRQQQEDFHVSLVYKVTSSLARATYVHPVSD